MPIALDTLYGIGIVVTLWGTAISLGASNHTRALRLAAQRRGLFVRLLVLDAVLVPLVVVGLVGVLAVPTDYALGLLVVGTAAAGPLGLKTSQLGRGDMPLAIALVIALELTNIVTMPIWARFVLPVSVDLPLVEIWRTLLLSVLLPLVIGFGIQHVAGRMAVTIARWAAAISTVALVMVLVVVFIRDGSMILAALGTGAPSVAIGTILVALALGWWLGGPDPASRRTAALVSSVRASTIALAVTTVAFGAGSPATSSVVVFGLCSLLVVPGAALVLGFRRPASTSIPNATGKSVS
jgi:BASS family bile acid:Na+ symporter